MKFFDFVGHMAREFGHNSHFADKIACLVIRNAQDELDDINVDDAVLDKIILMRQHNVPEEVMFIALQNSIDWYDRLDVRKFWKELGAWAKKMGKTKEEIKQDIEQYEKNPRVPGGQMSLLDALQRLEGADFRRDFLVHDLINYIVDPDTVEKEIADMRADTSVVDTLMRAHRAGWSEKDMIRELEKQNDDTPNFDTVKFSRKIQKALVQHERKVSGHDGSVKYISRISFLKYINPVLDFFTKNATKIEEISQKYRSDAIEFARAFYDLYVNYRGWGEFAPTLSIKLDDKTSASGGFTPEGFVELRHLLSQESIINTLIHELMHFEQYLMLINTPDIGVMPYGKRFIMRGMLELSDSYRFDPRDRVVVKDGDFKDMAKSEEEAALLMLVARKRFENDFYHNALKIPYEKITPDSPKYQVVQQLAESFTTTYNQDNPGNTQFLYSTLFSEQMAFTVGNAGAVMFRNIIMRNGDRNISDLSGILDFASRDF